MPFKALAVDRKSSRGWGGNFGPWVTDEWYEVEGPISFDVNFAKPVRGFFCSPDILSCMSSVRTEYICEVETGGVSIIHGTTQCWQRMRVTKIKAWPPAKGTLVADWAETRTHDYWAGYFPTEADSYENKRYQGQWAAMLSIIEPLYKSLFTDGAPGTRFYNRNLHHLKPGYHPNLESVLRLAYIVALARTNEITIYGGSGLVSLAEGVAPGSWAQVRQFAEDHWASLPEV